MTLGLTAVASLLLGILIGVGLISWLRPAPTAETTASTEETDGETEEAEPEAEASASAEPSAKPVDPAAVAAANKLFELRKKVKGQRSKQLDPECAKQFKKKYPAGYVYDGGKFEENQYVANASGCVAAAKTTKAPWFCCVR